METKTIRDVVRQVLWGVFFGVLLMPGLASAGAVQMVRPLSVDEIDGVVRSRVRNVSARDEEWLAEHIADLCDEFRFEPAFVLSVIHTESSFNSRAVSNKDARGLMQLLPGTARDIAERWWIPFESSADLFDPFTNVTLGVIYLYELRERFGSEDLFLAAYNAGPTRISRLVKKNQFRLVQLKPYVRGIQHGERRIRVAARTKASTLGI